MLGRPGDKFHQSDRGHVVRQVGQVSVRRRWAGAVLRGRLRLSVRRRGGAVGRGRRGDGGNDRARAFSHGLFPLEEELHDAAEVADVDAARVHGGRERGAIHDEGVRAEKGRAAVQGASTRV